MNRTSKSLSGEAKPQARLPDSAASSTRMPCCRSSSSSFWGTSTFICACVIMAIPPCRQNEWIGRLSSSEPFWMERIWT